MDSNITIPEELLGHLLNIDEILQAVETALEDTNADASEIVLRAASALQANASDFDRGMAAGFALARYIQRTSTTPIEPFTTTD